MINFRELPQQLQNIITTVKKHLGQSNVLGISTIIKTCGCFRTVYPLRVGFVKTSGTVSALSGNRVVSRGQHVYTTIFYLVDI